MNDLKSSIADQAFAFITLVDGDSDSPAMTRDDILQMLDSPEVLEILNKYDLSSKNPEVIYDILFLGLGLGLGIGVRCGIAMAVKNILNITDESEQNNDKDTE